MLNSRTFFNSRPDGYGVLEVADGAPDANGPRRFVPLKHTALTGTVTGPLAALHLAQTFALDDPEAAPIEALYRFPLPGDAAITGVRVRFGTVEIQTELKERERAEEDYRDAKRTGRQAALVTRESPDVFTLAVTGIRGGEAVIVETSYVQLAKTEGAGWVLRVPLTTAPRYVRADEAGSRHAAGQPLALLRDPGHRFALDLTFDDAESVASTTHALSATAGRVRLRDGDVLPDRDCVLTWRARVADAPGLRVWAHADRARGTAHFLALCAPPKFGTAKRVPREVVLLVDHSGSMQGPKWEAADWAVERFLAGLSEHDSFALGLFHDSTKWFAERPRKATPENVRAAVAYLKMHRDQGGTNLGVALEQALDRSRAADAPSRHVLILTDAEVSDAGRVLRLADTESAKPDRRRVSVLCIDAAPNAALANELAERGGGVARFLTSNPDDDDVTTALDEVLADWSAPVLSGLTLEVNRAGAEAAGRTVALLSPGPASAIDVGDLPAGRAVWVAGRVPLGTDALAFRLRTGAELVAEAHAPATDAPAIKALFGAYRVRRLEYVMTANYAGAELISALARLGHDAKATFEKVYVENATDDATKLVRELLVRESLDAGVPCAETAFVAVRREAGARVGETHVVANALPHGWSEGFANGAPASGAAGGAGMVMCRLMAAAPAPAAPAPPARAAMHRRPAAKAKDVPATEKLLHAQFGEVADCEDETTTDFDPLEAKKQRKAGAKPAAPGTVARDARRMKPKPNGVRVSITAGQLAPGDGAVLFYTADGGAGQFAFLALTFADKAVTADALDGELALLLFVGDLAVPRARVKLADLLRAGGRRPLNVRHAAGEPVRLVLADPSGAWAAGVPALEVVLG
jgi:Ca-activated chloride channel family protein